MISKDLMKIYSNITSYSSNCSLWDGLPHHLCGVCRALLLRGAGLRRRCRRAHQLLSQALHQHSLTTDFIRTIDRVSNQLSIHLIIDNQPPSIELIHDDNELIHDDNIDIIEDAPIDDTFDNSNNSDDILLKDLEIEKEIETPKKVLRKRKVKEVKSKKTNVKIVRRKERTVKKKEKEDKVEKIKKKKGFKRFFSCEEDYIKFENNYNISIEKVSEEEQRADMAARKLSANYARAHLRCEKCFKGFLSEATFENHQKVHDPIMGSNECHLCFARFKHPTRLRRHMETHTLKFLCKLCPLVTRHRGMAMMHSDFHSGKTFECKYCGLSFKKKTTFNTHIRVQHPLENLQGGACDVCGETFIGKRGLQQHKTMAHRKLPIPELKCVVCGVQFDNLDAVVRHAAADGCDPTLSACPACGLVFPSAEALRAHAPSHTAPVYSCDDCDKSFATKSSLGTHVDRVHLKIKPKKSGVYKYHLYPKKIQVRRVEEICEICGKGYPSSTWLKYHQRTHTGERPYTCAECPKSYMTPAALQSHSVSHTGVRRWQCSQCPKTFLHQSSIYKHKLVHTGEKPFSCHICSKTFTQSGSLATHVKYVHMKLKPPPRRRRHQPA